CVNHNIQYEILHESDDVKVVFISKNFKNQSSPVLREAKKLASDQFLNFNANPVLNGVIIYLHENKLSQSFMSKMNNLVKQEHNNFKQQLDTVLLDSMKTVRVESTTPKLNKPTKSIPIFTPIPFS